LRKDHRPYFLYRQCDRYESWHARHFLAPQCEFYGVGIHVMKPWAVEIFRGPVSIGDYTTLVAASDRKIRLSVWATDENPGRIDIGRYCILCPGVRITAATAVKVGDDCMIAQNALITDADWHDLYDRSQPIGNTQAVNIGTNVWIGDSAIVGKGVTIGKNAVIGAGSVVVKDIPENAIAAGNPASVVRYLDQDKPVKTRSQWMADPGALERYYDEIGRYILKDNTLLGWFKSLCFPKRGD
jgi:acetyltransferase-like isoleucine patch superfamily enzyme